MLRWYQGRPRRQLLNLSRSGVLGLCILAAGCIDEEGSRPESASERHPGDLDPPGLVKGNLILTLLAPSQADNAIPMRGLTDADHARRFRAVTKLADLEPNVRGPWFDLAYKDSSVAVRTEVIDTIAASGDRSAIGLVEQALMDPIRVVREQAIEALGEIGDQRSVPTLARMLDSEDADLREEVVLALASIGGTEAIEVLITTLDDSDGDVRESATEVLAELQENHE